LEIYLIRHTCPAIDKGVCYGQSDIGLAASFETEKKAVLKQLPDGFDLVYTSPLKRCMRLAESIKTKALVEDERLMELHFGVWEMRKWDEIPRQELDLWANNYLTATVPGGESFQDLKKRLSGFWEELKKHRQDKKIAVVTHHGIIQALLLQENIIEEEELFIKKIPYGGIIHLVAPLSTH
jgi:alpha-ribazole phosphatase